MSSLSVSLYVEDPKFHQDLPKARPNDRVEGIFLKSLKSPLFWSASAAGSFVATLSGYSPETIQPITAVALAAIGLGVAGFKWRKELWYELSLGYVVMSERYRNITGHRWYDKIHSHLILGAIPLNNLSHVDQLVQGGVSAVLSLVEDHEASTASLLGDPVMVDEWKRHKIDYLRIPTPDMTPPSKEKIQQGVEFIRANAIAGKTTYVHCKAGRGRSAVVVICYMMKYHREEIEKEGVSGDFIEKAVAYVRTRRPQLTLSRSQKRTLYAV